MTRNAAVTVALAPSRPFVPARNRRGLTVALIGLGVVLVGELVVALVLTGGSFHYSLDDPYIHLALSEHLRHGHYGINPGEPSNPSSSILWPLVLSLGVGTPVHAWIPLFLNGLLTLAAGAVIVEILTRSFPRCRPVTAGLTAVALAIGLNLVGVAFTGLEHSLQVVLCLAIGLGMSDLLNHRVAPRWLMPALIAAPAVRYECLGLTAVAAGVLIAHRRTRNAALLVAGSLATPVLFGVFWVQVGLPALPSSVLMKSRLTATGDSSLLHELLTNAVNALQQPLMVAMLIWTVVALSIRALRRSAGFFVLAVLGAQGLAGRFDMWHRYALWAYAAVIPVLLLCVHRHSMEFAWANTLRRAALAAVVVGVSVPHLLVTLATPWASRNTYLQQGQMAGFLRAEWAGPVAVNDIGLVSYRYERGEVIDLWGLASPEVQQHRSDSDPCWLGDLVDRHGAELALIYAHWFTDQLPRRWVYVGTLSTGGYLVTSGARNLDVFATNPDAAFSAKQKLRHWAGTVPSGTTVTLANIETHQAAAACGT